MASVENLWSGKKTDCGNTEHVSWDKGSCESEWLYEGELGSENEFEGGLCDVIMYVSKYL